MAPKLSWFTTSNLKFTKSLAKGSKSSGKLPSSVLTTSSKLILSNLIKLFFILPAAYSFGFTDFFIPSTVSANLANPFRGKSAPGSPKLKLVVSFSSLVKVLI